jgi:hypothetical protein
MIVCALCLMACGGDKGGSDSDSSPTDVDEDVGNKKDASVRDAGAKDAGRKDAKVEDTTKRDASIVDPDTCAAITKDAPVMRGAVDVIWVVDNSLSMFDKILQVQANISNFFNTIESSGADVHIVSMTIANLAAGTPLENNADKHLFVAENVQSKLCYESALARFDDYQSFLRADASTHIIIVSDDNDLTSGPEFVKQMEAKLGHPFTLQAIVAQDIACGALGGVGDNYMSAADQTGGQKISVCSQDWTQVFNMLTTAVVSSVPLPCSYDMAEAATSTDKYDPKKVAVTYTPAAANEKQELPKSTSADKCADKPGWYYDDENNPTKLELCPAACELVKAGGNMSIAFGCEPMLFL